MEESALLIGFAQLCLVLTGFVAVFVAFFSNGSEASKPDVHHALSMLIGSVLAFVIALVPLVLSAYGLSGTSLWYWSSIVGFALSFAYGAVMSSLTVRLSWEEFKEAGIIHMGISYILGFGAGGLLLWNIVTHPGPGHYVLAMAVTLMVALIGFVSFSVQNFLKL